MNDWSQLDSLVDQGAEYIVWSIGVGGPRVTPSFDTQQTAVAIATKYPLSIVSAVDTKSRFTGDAGLVAAGGTVVEAAERALTGLPRGYSAEPRVLYGDL